MSFRETIEPEGFEEFVASLDPDVVWVGLRPGQLCRNKEQVVGIFRRKLADGYTGTPEVLAHSENTIVVDPHVEPPYEHAPELHHVFVVEDGRIVEMRDYPNRRAALEAVGL